MTQDWRARLREAMAQKGLKMKTLSLSAGLGETYVRDILERDRDPSVENARKIADQLGMPYHEIFAEPGRNFEPAPATGGIVELGGVEHARIPVFDIRFAAGAGAFNYSEQPIDYYPFSVSFLRTMTNAPVDMIVGFQSMGDSMESTIFDRDWCFADMRHRNLMQPGIYAMVFEGEGLLKRASHHIETRAVTLISDNRKYPAMTIKKPERLSVVGRVFMSIRRH